MTPRAVHATRSSAGIEPLTSRIDPPLSVNQEGRFLAEALSLAFGGARRRKPFHTSRCVRLIGELDIARFQHAADALVARHEIFRTTFATPTAETAAAMAPSILAGSIGLYGRNPFRQAVRPGAGRVLQLVDVQGLRGSRRAATAVAIAWQLINRPFDYGRAPLMRIGVIRCDAREHVLVIVLHHVISDDWSLGIVFDDLSRAYNAATAAGGESPRPRQLLPPLPIQYADFAAWQRDILQSAHRERAIAHWIDQWSRWGASQLQLKDLELGGGTPEARRRPRVAEEIVTIGPSVAHAMRKFAMERRVTLYMLFFAAFQLVLRSYSQKTAIGVRAYFANRTQMEIEEVVGWFANEQLLAVDAPPSTRVEDFLGRVRTAVTSALQYQDVPFALIVTRLTGRNRGVGRLRSRFVPRFMRGPRDAQFSTDLYVSFAMYTQTWPAFEGLAASEFPDPGVDDEACALKVLVIHDRDEIRIMCQYSRDRFGQPDIRTMLSQIELAVQHMIASPARTLWEVTSLVRASLSAAGAGTGRQLPSAHRPSVFSRTRSGLPRFVNAWLSRRARKDSTADSVQRQR